MVTPISNDKIMPSDSANSAVTGKKKADQGIVPQAGTNSSALEEDSIDTNSIDIDRANQIFSRSTPRPLSDEDRITSPEQAKAMVTQIRLQIEEDGLQALKAQTGAGSAALASLLEAAPL